MSWDDDLTTREAETIMRACRACGRVGHLIDLEPILTGPGPHDLGTLLGTGGAWWCRNAELCLRRFGTATRGTVLCVAIVAAPPPGAAGGMIPLITTDPRRAEEYAAMVGGCTVRWEIHNDYRRDRA